MTDLILVEKPEALNIPYFALSREPQSYIQRLDFASEFDGEGTAEPVMPPPPDKAPHSPVPVTKPEPQPAKQRRGGPR
jgi:hypothetical protein